MPFSVDPEKLFIDILEDIAKIDHFIQGVDRISFEEDERIAYAVKYALLRISEAAHRLKNEADDLCPEVPWRDIRGLGNRLRHAYDTIDIELIWMTLEKDLPPLKAAVMAALDRLQNSKR